MAACLLPLLLLLPSIHATSECFRFSSSCSSCIQAGSNCGWDLNSDLAALWRCSNQDGSDASPHIFSPRSSIHESVPKQQFAADLRLDDYRRFITEVKLKDKAAVDIYILSDMSFSMRESLKEISDTAGIIVRKIEQNAGRGRVRLGFGGFVDKPIMPFIHGGGGSCSAASEEKVVCDEPYSYRHVLNFTKNMTHFNEIVDRLNPSVSLDKQDGGLDALLQIAVCPEVVRWNPQALKIVVFATSSGIHIQGDGWLAGIAENADLRCHTGLTKKGTVEHLRSLEMDYPSIGLVATALEKAGISVMFLATKPILPLYVQLSKELPSASAAQLPEKSRRNNSDVAKIAEILSRSYKEITRLVTLERLPDAYGSQIETDIFAQCSTGGSWETASECPEVRLAGLVRFRIGVRLRQCLTAPVDLHFRSTGLEDSSLRVRVSSLCDCGDCAEQVREAPEECGGAAVGAKLVCGVCQCPIGRAGLHCECAASAANASREEVPCKGQGRWSCGKCYCADGYGGDDCGSVSFCPKDTIRGRVCGGSSFGRCDRFGRCICNEGYGGDACDCEKDQEEELNCRRKNSAEILQGKNICDNNLTRSCVLCHFENTPVDRQNADHACETKCMEHANVTLNETVTGTSLCIIEGENRCRIVASHHLKGKNLNLVVGRRCEFGVVYQASLPLFSAVIACIILVGLILLGIWKLVVYFEDKAEYLRLEEHQNNWIGESNSNPLYLSPETEVKNPLFDPEDTDDVGTMLN